MYEIDNTWDGFEWMNADDAEHSTYCFVRKCSSSKNNLLFVLNMTPMKWENYTVPVPKKKKYKLLLNSDEELSAAGAMKFPQRSWQRKSLTITRIILSALICPLTELLYFCSKSG